MNNFCFAPMEYESSGSKEKWRVKGENGDISYNETNEINLITKRKTS